MFRLCAQIRLAPARRRCWLSERARIKGGAGVTELLRDHVIIGTDRCPTRGHWRLGATSTGAAAPRQSTAGKRHACADRLNEALHRGRLPAGRDILYVAIDPDLGGALAAMRMTAAKQAGRGSRRGAEPAAEMNGCKMGQELIENLMAAAVELHDMPCEQVKVGKTMRRRPDVGRVVRIAQDLQDTAAGARVVVCIEQPRPQPVNGALSCYAQGLSFGTWYAAMSSQGFEVVPIEPSVWKKDMNLWRKDKESSRQFALDVFPQLADRMKRKKDHGRAEALLLMTWAILTTTPPSP
eukprot:jgi/Tetstr1/422747/TSEL_013544.t1